MMVGNKGQRKQDVNKKSLKIKTKHNESVRERPVTVRPSVSGPGVLEEDAELVRGWKSAGGQTRGTREEWMVVESREESMAVTAHGRVDGGLAE